MTDSPPYKPKGLTIKVHLQGGQTRLAESILYVSDACAKASRFGLTKLNKIIWRADFTSFAERYVPVTGRAYQKLPMGPAPIEMRPLLSEMSSKGHIEIDFVDAGNGRTEQRVVAIMPANRRFFSQDDLTYLDAAIQYYWDKTGTEASDDSHGIAWKTREDGEAMPYELAFLSDRQLNQDQIARFSHMANERGWRSA